MPSRWQQWMPFRIDAFKGSPAVQAMHPCARIGYLYLLACAWQTDDCTLSCDPLELAEQSGLGDELWAVHSSRILRKFEWSDESHSRLRNDVLFDEWKEAKRVFDARRQAADRTNAVRSPNGHRNAEPSAPSRSADTQTLTNTDTETVVQKPSRAKAARGKYSPESLTLYGLYPRHDGKIAGLRAIDKALKLKPFDEMLLAVKAYAHKVKIEGTEEQFVPYPATWFNQGRYEDDMTPHPKIRNGSMEASVGSHSVTKSPSDIAFEAAVEEDEKHQDEPGAEDWRRILALLKKHVNAQTFTTWLQPTRYSRTEETVIFIRVPSQEFLHIGDKFREEIKSAATELRLAYHDFRFISPEKVSA